MKKRVFLIIVSIIEIIIFCYNIFIADNIIEENLLSIKSNNLMYSEEMNNSTIKIYEEKGANIIRLFSIIGIGISLLTLFISIKNAILRNKGLLIIFSILHIIFGVSWINQLLSVISILVLLCLKRVDPEDFPIKRKLPILEKDISNKRETIIGIIIVIIYFSQFIWKKIIPDSQIAQIIISCFFYLTIFVLSILYWNLKLLKNFKIFGKNIITYIKYILPRMIAMYGIYFLIAIMVTIITGDVGTANQEALEKMNKYIVIPLAILWAPIVEETIFRGMIHKVIKNKYLYIIGSAICFGLLHTVGQEVTVLNTFVKALPYSVLGGFLAYIYDRTNNISTSMFGHALINTIGSIASFM